MDLVQRGVSVIFFPEGTRTSDGTMAAFKVSSSSSGSGGTRLDLQPAEPPPV